MRLTPTLSLCFVLASMLVSAACGTTSTPASPSEPDQNTVSEDAESAERAALSMPRRGRDVAAEVATLWRATTRRLLNREAMPTPRSAPPDASEDGASEPVDGGRGRRRDPRVRR